MLDVELSYGLPEVGSVTANMQLFADVVSFNLIHVIGFPIPAKMGSLLTTSTNSSRHDHEHAHLTIITELLLVIAITKLRVMISGSPHDSRGHLRSITITAWTHYLIHDYSR